MEKKAFLLFTVKIKTVCSESHEISYSALTALIKIHCQLSHVMRISVRYFIAHANRSQSGCFTLSLCQDKTHKKTSCPLLSPKKPKRQKSGGISKFSVKQDLKFVTVGRIVLN